MSSPLAPPTGIVTQREPLESAYAYAELGLPVIPLCTPDHRGMSRNHRNTCRNPGKAPLLDKWPQRGVPTPEEIDEWRRTWPMANIGLVLGEFVRVDVDGEAGLRLLAEKSGGNIPDTWAFRTGGGNLGYIYAVPGGVTARKWREAQKVGEHQELALLGKGQQTAIPPSRHASGATYEWLPGKDPWSFGPPAPAPQWIIDLMTLREARPPSNASTQTQEGEEDPHATLQALTERCPRFRKDWATQQGPGLDEESWFLWLSALVAAGKPAAARAFSEASSKHTERSESRLAELVDRQATDPLPPVRCLTFGCTPEDVARCHGRANVNEAGQVTNSPLSLLADDRASLVAARKKAHEAIEAARADPGAPFAPEALEALAALREKHPGEWQRVRAALKKAGVGLRALDRAVAAATRDMREQTAAPMREGLPYSVLGGQICYTKQTHYGPEIIPLANFDGRIVAEIVRDDGAEQARVFAVQGTLSTGAPLPRVEVPAERYSTMTWVTEKWGTRALVYAGQAVRDHLRVAIQHLSGEVPQKTVFAHLGWRKISGKWAYLHAGGAIGADGPLHGLEVEVEEALRDYVLPDPPPDKELRRAVQASLSLLELAPDRITVPLQGATYLAPLGEAVPLDLSVFLAGATGGFKTEATALVQAHWGTAWNGRHLPGSWHDTANSLEKAAFLAKDAVFVVDDFAPQGTASDIQRLQHEADRLLRGQGNRAGRKRMRPDGSLRPEYRPRGIVVSSGEDIPAGQSLRARVCIVEVAAPHADCPGDVHVNRLTQAQEQAAQGLFAQAMAGYVRWLAPQMEALKATLPERRRKLREQAYREGLHRRIPDEAAALALGWETFLRFALEVGAITQDERAAMWQRVWAGLGQMAAAQAEQQAAEDPAAKFIALLSTAIASGRAHVARAKDGTEPETPQLWGWREKWVGAGENLRSEWQPQGELVGWLDAPDIYLLPDAAYAVAQRLARDQNASLPVGPKTLWKRLAEQKLLTATEGKKNTVKRVVVGTKKRVICLHVDSMLSPTKGEMGEMEENPTAPTGSGVQNLPHSAGTGRMGDLKMGEQEAGGVPDTNSPVSAPPFSGALEKWGSRSNPITVEPQRATPVSPVSPIPPDKVPATGEEELRNEAPAAFGTEREVVEL